MNFIDKVWEKQRTFELWLKDCWKRVKKHRKAKISNKTLVPIEDVVWLRNGLIAIAMFCFVPAVINVFTHWFDWVNPCQEYIAMGLWCEYSRPWFAGLHVYGWAFVMMLGFFGLVVDFCVYKRKGDSLFF